MAAESHESWPFEDPPNTASYTTANVLERGFPILLVTNDADDGAWQFLCGETNATEDGGKHQRSNKGMKLTSVERIGRSQLVPGVHPLLAERRLTDAGWSGSLHV